jgi:cytochrome P450
VLANEHPNVQLCPVEEAFDPFDPAYLADPYPFFAAVRARGPVFYAPQIDMYAVTCYQDIEAVFMNLLTGSLCPPPSHKSSPG